MPQNYHLPISLFQASMVTGLERFHNRVPAKISRIYHQSLMQIEKFQPEGKRILRETRFIEFPALSVDPRVEISRSASETDD